MANGERSVSQILNKVDELKNSMNEFIVYAYSKKHDRLARQFEKLTDISLEVFKSRSQGEDEQAREQIAAVGDRLRKIERKFNWTRWSIFARSVKAFTWFDENQPSDFLKPISVHLISSLELIDDPNEKKIIYLWYKCIKSLNSLADSEFVDGFHMRFDNLKITI